MTSPNRIPARSSRIVAATVVGATFLLGACAPNGENPTARPSIESTRDDTTAAVETIVISRSRFDTAELRIAAGTTVVWRNDDGFAHTVTSRDGAPAAFDSGEFSDGATFEMTFDEPGEYAYFCRIHPTMRAVVIVG